MNGSSNPVPPPLGPRRRYTIRFKVEPSEGEVVYRVVTALGELKAAAMAAIRLIQDRPDSRFSAVDVVEEETDFNLDPERDLRDYWGSE